MAKSKSFLGEGSFGTVYEVDHKVPLVDHVFLEIMFCVGQFLPNVQAFLVLRALTLFLSKAMDHSIFNRNLKINL